MGQKYLMTASRFADFVETVSPRFSKQKRVEELNLSRTGFDSLWDFVVHEIKIMASEYAKVFFWFDNKEVQTSSRSKTIEFV